MAKKATKVKAQDKEVIYIDADIDEVSCDGGGALGHPRVYYTFEGRQEITCEYCGRIFSHKKPRTKK